MKLKASIHGAKREFMMREHKFIKLRERDMVGGASTSRRNAECRIGFSPSPLEKGIPDVFVIQKSAVLLFEHRAELLRIVEIFISRMLDISEDQTDQCTDTCTDKQ